MNKIIEIFTDGACRGNPGPGGWGALLRYNDSEKELSGAVSQTTNNRMELTAAIKALEALNEPCRVCLTTDSNYVKTGIEQWIKDWKRRGWRTANKRSVKNQDLWQRLDQVAERHEIEWRWVRGHSGHAENERVDALANEAMDKMIKNQPTDGE